MYKLAVARKQATLSKLGDVPRQCLVEKQVSCIKERKLLRLKLFLIKGWSAAFRDAIFGGDGRDQKCEAYYEVCPTRIATEDLVLDFND